MLIDFGVFFDKKYPKIVLGKSRWDLHVEIPNFGSVAAIDIRFDLVDQIPPFAPYLPLRIGIQMICEIHMENDESSMYEPWNFDVGSAGSYLSIGE